MPTTRATIHWLYAMRLGSSASSRKEYRVMKTRVFVHIILLLSILCLPTIVCAQEKVCKPPNARNLTDYIEERICENLKGRVDQTDPTKQADAPAAAENSTSLVERSSAPDLLGFGLDFLNLSDSTCSTSCRKETSCPMG